MHADFGGGIPFPLDSNVDVLDVGELLLFVVLVQHFIPDLKQSRSFVALIRK